MKSLLCKFCVILKFLLANKSFSTVELELYRKAHDECFTCRIREPLLYLTSWHKQSQIKCLYVNNMTVVATAKMLISLSTYVQLGPQI